MTDPFLDDWDAVGDVVERALERPEAERDAMLEDAFRPDADQLARARRALSAADRARRFLDTPPVLTGPPSAPGDAGEDAPPTRVGAYRVLQAIGQGGMGEVYLGERADDEFRRRVAIKLVRAGLGGDLPSRFRAERQLLASLDHPHIAQLFDGGVTADGRPYLVMEYVDGAPLDAFADAHRLDVDARLDLFLQVCSAVERAHRALVVHRDLKPGNILVTTEGAVKLLDFGVAKLLDDPVGVGAPETRAGTRLLTPEYASPEQFLGEATTTATDVYSLGVVLYELLTGRRPFEDAEQPLPAFERRVLDGTMATPSGACRLDVARASADRRARARGLAVDALARMLRGDLDTIVLKALRREPDQRYRAVADLRADLEHHRAGRPVTARPATARYRTAKFVRRHRVTVAAAVLVTSAIGVGTATTLVQAQAAARQGERAERIRDFLVGVFQVSDPDQSRGEAVTARELLDRGSARIASELEGDPLMRADMLGVLGTLYRQLGLYDSARRHLEEALGLERGAGVAPAVLIDRLTNLVAVDNELGAYEAAAALADEAVALAGRVDAGRGRASAEALTARAAVHRGRGEFAVGEARSREALAVRRTLGDPAGLATTLNGLGVLLMDAGKSVEAIAAMDEALAQGRAAFGPEHTSVVLTVCNLATARHRAGQLDAALATFRQCVADRRRLLGDRHPDVALILNNQGLVHADRNEYDDAERLYREALDIQRATFGDLHRSVAGTTNNLAILAFMRNDYAEAARHFRELVPLWESLLGRDHPDTLATINNLGMSLRSAGRFEEAERTLTEVLDGRRRAFGADSPQVAESLMNLASVMQRTGRYSGALALITEALPMLERAFPAPHPLRGIALVALGRALDGERRHAEALDAFDRAIEMRTGLFGAEHLQTAEARVGRGRALAGLGRTVEGRAAIEEALQHLAADNRMASQTAQDAMVALEEIGRRATPADARR